MPKTNTRTCGLYILETSILMIRWKKIRNNTHVQKGLCMRIFVSERSDMYETYPVLIESNWIPCRFFWRIVRQNPRTSFPGNNCHPICTNIYHTTISIFLKSLKVIWLIDHLRNRLNFDLNKSGQKFHHSLKEHHKISNIPKFRCEML